MKVTKTIARILSISLILILMPMMSFADIAEWDGKDIPQGETKKFTGNIGWTGNITIRGELIIEDGGYLSAGLNLGDVITVFGKITIKNGGNLFNHIPIYNNGRIIVEKGGELDNYSGEEYTNGTIYNEGDIVVQRGATFNEGNTIGSGLIYDLNNNQNIMCGTVGMGSYDSAAGYSYIYFGNNQSYSDGNAGIGPLKWRVLDADKGSAISAFQGQPDTLKNGQTTVANNDAMLLFSDRTIDETVFGPNSNKWQDSSAQSWCNTFLTNVMKPAEGDAILAITKNDPEGWGFGGAPEVLKDDMDKAFFLSGRESLMTVYGFSTGVRIDSNRADGASWWLRSPINQNNYSDYVASVNKEGRIVMNPPNVTSSARPAFNLDKNSVLFSSKAESGKASGTLGSSALTAVPDNFGREWKLTLKDANRNFNVTASASTGKKAYLTYQGAAPYHRESAPNEYISAIVKNEFGVITYYGRITRPEDASGQTSITLPDNFDGNKDKLYVFSEQYNNDKYTDYASEPVEVPAVKNAYSIKNSLTNIISSNKQDYRPYDTNDAYKATLTADSGFSLPSAISVMIGDEKLAEAEYTYRDGKLSIPANKITGDIEIIAEAVKETQVISDISESDDDSEIIAEDTEKTHGNNGMSETGDDSNILLWFAIAVIGALSMLSAIFVKKRHNRQ